MGHLSRFPQGPISKFDIEAMLKSNEIPPDTTLTFFTSIITRWIYNRNFYRQVYNRIFPLFIGIEQEKWPKFLQRRICKLHKSEIRIWQNLVTNLPIFTRSRHLLPSILQNILNKNYARQFSKYISGHFNYGGKYSEALIFADPRSEYLYRKFSVKFHRKIRNFLLRKSYSNAYFYALI